MCSATSRACSSAFWASLATSARFCSACCWAFSMISSARRRAFSTSCSAERPASWSRAAASAELLERRRPLAQVVELAPQRGLGLLGRGVEADRLLEARQQLGDVGVDLVAVVPAPDHPEGRRSLPASRAGPRFWLVHAHGTLRRRSRRTVPARRGSKIASPAPTAQTRPNTANRAGWPYLAPADQQGLDGEAEPGRAPAAVPARPRPRPAAPRAAGPAAPIGPASGEPALGDHQLADRPEPHRPGLPVHPHVPEAGALDQVAQGRVVAEGERRPMVAPASGPMCRSRASARAANPGLWSIDRQTITASCPPGASTLAISASAAGRSGSTGGRAGGRRPRSSGRGTACGRRWPAPTRPAPPSPAARRPPPACPG